MEQTLVSLSNNQVPDLWKLHSYFSTESLAVWLKDLEGRIGFFADWVAQGGVMCCWLSAFFHPRAFLTAALQNYSRAKGVPIDALTVYYSMVPKEPAAGLMLCGLFIEGAKWSTAKECIEEAEGRAICSPMPGLWAQPMAIADVPNNKHVYECPVYCMERKQGAIYEKSYLLTMNLPMNNKDTQRQWIHRGVSMSIQSPLTHNN
eukprot:TRINITY_DN472_c0_g2_i3.p2 TRINITY_DN472_c0_g2~~TRINITY_DN472_c0_g2_i3.p2  ORF type:complete len:204 (+),score=42.19 TRINITY_DN472_c0_g2_i3:191-802(+)